VEKFPEDPAAHLLDAWALVYTWDAAPTSEILAALGERLAELSRVDPSSPYDELMRGFIYRSSGEPDLARMLYSRVVARTDLTRTTRAWALRQRSLTYQIIGNAAAARDDAEKAIELDPVNASSLFALSRALEAMGRLDDAVSVSRQALALTPFAWRQHQRLGLVLSRLGMFDEAVLFLERACRLGENQEACANLAVTLQRGGREPEALAAAKHAESLGGSPFGPYNLACYWSLAGETTLAIGALRRSLELGFADVLITTDPDLDVLRGDPEFEAIVVEVGERLRSRRELSLSVFPWQARVATAPSTARA
jgi:Tfp pilus assembly protein PilF